MKFDISRNWSAFAADLEKGFNVAAGNPAYPPGTSPPPSPVREDHAAFSRFLSLSRRKRRLSLEALAEKADVDADDLLAIELDPRAPIEPRIIRRLARFFGVPAASLLRLAGLMVDRRSRLADGAVHAAAQAVPMDELTQREQHILDALIDDIMNGGT